jgi:hypothetical protein
MAYNFSGSEKQSLFNNSTGAWADAFPWDTRMPENETIHGVRVKVYTASDEPSSIKKNKLRILKEAIKGLQSAGIMFSSQDVEEFKVAFYPSSDSRGVAYMKTATSAKPCVALMLGPGLTKHMISSDGLPVENAAGGKSDGKPSRILADRIYDYYKPTKTISEKDRCALAQIYHEMGHIFHQLSSPGEYFLNASVAEGTDNSNAAVTREQLHPDVVRLAKAFVSQYAGNAGGKKELNEIVAEVFAGIMMGVDWDQVDTSGELMNTYRTLGGPIPPTPRTMSRMNDFIGQKCRCPGAGGTVYGNDAKIFYWQ